MPGDCQGTRDSLVIKIIFIPALLEVERNKELIHKKDNFKAVSATIYSDNIAVSCTKKETSTD